MKTNVDLTDELLTVKEVGAHLKLTAKAVHYLIYQGKLKAVYMAGRRVRVTKSQLETFLREELRPA